MLFSIFTNNITDSFWHSNHPFSYSMQILYSALNNNSSFLFNVLDNSFLSLYNLFNS